MKNLLLLGEVKNKMLFEIAPNIFPEGYVTDVEIMLWDKHYGEKKDNG